MVNTKKRENTDQFKERNEQTMKEEITKIQDIAGHQ